MNFNNKIIQNINKTKIFLNKSEKMCKKIFLRFKLAISENYIPIYNI